VVLLVMDVLFAQVYARENAKIDGIEWRSAEDWFRLKLGARLMVDAAFFDDAETALDDGIEIRRARLVGAARLFRGLRLVWAQEFAGRKPRVREAWLAYAGFKPWRFKFGFSGEPMSLEESTSSSHLTFMERALPNALVPEEGVGFQVSTRGTRWTAAAGGFGGTLAELVGANDNEWGITGRLTYAPILGQRRLLHLGSSATHRIVRHARRVRFDTTPESHRAEVDLVKTGAIRNVRDYRTLGWEAATVAGPWSMQWEYLRTDLDREGSAPDLDFHGWYVFDSWFLTGESRAYQRHEGVFGAVTPKRATGAWELALRYSTLDLSDGPVEGGEERNLTLGVNWYVNRNLRLMTNLNTSECKTRRRYGRGVALSVSYPADILSSAYSGRTRQRDAQQGTAGEFLRALATDGNAWSVRANCGVVINLNILI
jgi:Phosphate-selective porin